MRLNWFEASAEEDKLVSLLVHLHPLPVVLDLSIHAIGTLLHGHGCGATGFCLRERGREGGREGRREGGREGGKEGGREGGGRRIRRKKESDT